MLYFCNIIFFFSSRRRHTRWPRDWSSDVCSSDLLVSAIFGGVAMAILAGVLFLMKLLSYAMAFFLILAALAGVVSQGFGSALSFFKGWVGYTAITSMTTLLFAFVFLMASGLLRAGDGIDRKSTR